MTLHTFRIGWSTRPCNPAFRRAARISRLLLALVVSAGNSLPGESQSPAPLDLQYHLRLLRPTTHLLEVEIDAAKVAELSLDFVMPAWSPGRYAIYDFAKNVQEFEAFGAQGQSLRWTKLDKQTWRVETREGGGAVRVHYRVFANDLSGSFSQFDTSHANLNGASLYMYVAGHKQDPVTLAVDAPASWKLISGFAPSTERRSFQALNYDRLLDTPIEISGECSLEEFRERGKAIRVAVHGYAEQESNHSKLLDALKKIVRSEMAMMPDPDFEHYTFIFHFAPDITAGDGMEHLNSTQVVIRGDLSEGLPEALVIAAHEFFHLWNGKRLRPVALGPFDYTRETYTQSLWFVEGLTNYYSYIHHLRSGVWGRKEFLKRLAEEIRDFEVEPGRALMSAQSSSFHAWFYDRSPQMQETNFANTTISYYNKGALLGMLLDLEIRSRTHAQKSLDDLVVSMYRNFYGASPVSPYGAGRGYEEKDILEAANAMAGGQFTEFFKRYVEGTDPLPYAETLGLAGLGLRVAVSPGSAPSLGVWVQRQDRGLRIAAVRPGAAADRGGLARDDLLLDVDGLPLAADDLKDRLKIYLPGTEVPFTVERHGRQERISVTLDPPMADQYSIEEAPGATDEQIRVRDSWLGRDH